MRHLILKTVCVVGALASTAVLMAHAKASEEVWKSGRRSDWRIELHLFPGGHFHSEERFTGESRRPMPTITMDGTWHGVRRGLELHADKEHLELPRGGRDEIAPERKRMILPSDGRGLIWRTRFPGQNERLRRISGER